MKSSRFAAVFGLFLVVAAGSISAEEIKGKVKLVDTDKNEITLTVGEADQVLGVATDAKFLGQFGKKIKKAETKDIAGGLRGIKVGSDVVLETATKDGKVAVTQVKVEGLQTKAKKAKKKAE